MSVSARGGGGGRSDIRDPGRAGYIALETEGAWVVCLLFFLRIP